MSARMPQAECQNCDHEWALTKPPGDYTRGWPTCPSDGCGSTKVLVNGKGKSDVLDTTDADAAAQGQGEQANGAEIQTQEEAAAMQAGGEQIANSLAAAFDENANIQERSEGVMRGTNILGGLISGFMKRNERQRRAEQQRAVGADIQPVEDKPQCECGFTFSRIPTGASRVQCENCGAEYEIVG